MPPFTHTAKLWKSCRLWLYLLPLFLVVTAIDMPTLGIARTRLILRQIGLKQFRLLPSSQHGGSKIKSFLCDVNFEKSNYSIHHYQGKVAWTQHLHMPGSYQSSLKYIREWVTKAKQWSDLGPIKWQNMAGLPTSHYGSKGWNHEMTPISF